MSLRGVYSLRTICEVLREINDVLQGSAGHKKVHPLLIEAEDMAKKMSRKLREYNREWDTGWWEENKDFEDDLINRENERYIV